MQLISTRNRFAAGRITRGGPCACTPAIATSATRASTRAATTLTATASRGSRGARGRAASPATSSLPTASRRRTRRSGTQFNRKKFGLSFGLKNGLRFHFNFVTCLNYPLFEHFLSVLGEWSGYHTGKGEKLTCSQAETGQAIKSAVAYFPSISCVAS